MGVRVIIIMEIWVVHFIFVLFILDEFGDIPQVNIAISGILVRRTHVSCKRCMERALWGGGRG